MDIYSRTDFKISWEELDLCLIMRHFAAYQLSDIRPSTICRVPPVQTHFIFKKAITEWFSRSTVK